MSEVGLHKTELDTPFLWVDLDTLEKNIAEMASYMRDAGVTLASAHQGRQDAGHRPHAVARRRHRIDLRQAGRGRGDGRGRRAAIS